MSTLEEKILHSEALLSDLAGRVDPARVRVAWTGGKDSTVVLFIWKTLVEHAGAGPVRAINLDTGCKFPEVLAFRDRMAAAWGVDLHVARPAVALAGYPLARDPLVCCRELKVEPLKKAVRETGTDFLLTGIRRDEHPDRIARKEMEERSDPDHTLVNPLLDWTESDVWAFHARFGLPHCELYDQGYRSLGCRPCTTLPDVQGGERSGRAGGKEAVLSALTNLGYF
ncbi:phosphoadenosine phosphosulfate reductase family protein [Pseudodesulfovibrio thermohalotolerans]|uniref:phosphoadenosine phosphosulfate reductase family protein n=1 Tax=Pseudodesulfovibrio thermohalotolerans TaxID=2880651 RepID=UPI002441CCCD|nr:phosphoadenosine phosphosulfate reductase family protein [Pseudodesulfovibrio thermohalotolerans]WFS63232.1 phosphoadenosine phosphosulfate reductase family protein [Pseudodesulfovibrio thermohalotolerans]